MEVSTRVDRLVLIIGRRDAEIDDTNFPNFSVVDAKFRRNRRPLNLWRVNRLAVRLIKSESINVVHDTFATLLPLMYFKSRFGGVVFLTSLFQNEGWRLKRVWGDVPLRKKIRSRSTATMYLNRAFEHQVIKRADYVVVQGPGLVDRVLEFNKRERSDVKVVTNNVDVDLWTPNANRGVGPARLSSRLKLLFIGGVGPTRGVPALIEATALLVERGTDVRLTLAGPWEPTTEPELRALIKRRGIEEQVDIAGRVSSSNVLDAFHQHDIFVYLTINDGSPRVVLEALSAGIPIIASRHPGIRALDPASEAISFVDLDNPSRIADLAADCAANPEAWRKKAKRGREIAISHFESTVVARQYAHLYKDVLAGKRAL